ncbi:hypothetical protein ACIP98_37225 [Streptomyces sp. NPDC088354]|uniref:hypothetical protein n=1 Tax=Streptomyces sp. NPDC088354 TaxID=3365856 RepID=UPI00382B7208
MTVFVCAECDAVLSVPLSQVAFPAHGRLRLGHGFLPALMEQGTYAVDPEPTGPPWRRWSDISEEEAVARGVFAPVSALSFGDPGAIVVAPGDTRGTVLIPERCDGCCFGLDGRDGPNLACEQCGQPVATRIDDCSLWQEVRFAPRAVRPTPARDAAPHTVNWRALAAEVPGTPPIDPCGGWNPQWTAAAGVTLAHLVAASDGAPLAVPDGPVADTFRRTLDALLRQGRPAKTVALAGPGLPAPEPTPDILLVPQHPRTGKAWQPPGSARAVPLAAEVWMHLAFPNEGLPVPATGRLPDGVLRDDPLPMHPWGMFRPDSTPFRYTLARLPAVRQPWLRKIYDGG